MRWQLQLSGGGAGAGFLGWVAADKAQLWWQQQQQQLTRHQLRWQEQQQQ